MISGTTAGRCLLLVSAAVRIPFYHAGKPWGVNDPIDAGLGPIHNEVLASVLQNAERDSHHLATRTSPLPIEYSIFRGHSSLRNLSDQHLIHPETWFPSKTCQLSALRRACAVLLLLRGKLDAAHELILGVTWNNMEEAEYAATHRGQTNWTQEHPLTDKDDVIHATLHRLEGSARGEGNQTGYANAKYWLAGGPKALEKPAQHVVRTALVRIARKHAPCCVDAGVISRTGATTHVIIADGGKTRNVCVPEGEWDGFVFVDICERWESGELSERVANEVSILQRAELVLLLRTELEDCLGLACDESAAGNYF